MNPRLWIAIGLAAGSTVGACYRYDPTYCGNLDGHATCRDLGLGQFCSLCDFERDGCVNERPSADCLAPFEIPGEAEGYSGSSGSETMDAETTVSSTSSAGSETGSSGSSGDAPCAGPEDCSGSTPFCGPFGICVSCDAMEDPNGACASMDAYAPLCVGGSCVACTAEDTSVCDEQLQLCNVETNECVGCTEHAQCESGACQLLYGQCFPPDAVVHVDGDGGADYPSVVAAVSAVPDGSLSAIVVHELDDQTPYAGSALIDGEKTIALLGAAGESPSLQGAAGNPGLRLEGPGTTVYLDRLEISFTPGGGVGFRANGGIAWIDRSRIIQNSGGGILAENSASLTVRNCFIGGGTTDVDAVAINGASLAMVYTTAGGGTVLAGRSRALFCEGPTIAQVRNSILLSADTMPEVECPIGTITDSATESDVGNLNPGWFSSYASGDFSLSGSGANVFADFAVWQEGDPVTDIDGEPRPAVAGTPGYAGADVP